MTRAPKPQPPLDDAAVDRLRALDDAALRAACELQVFRGSGPGGQKRNKTSSGVRIVHRPTGLSAVATVDRSQQRNLANALGILRLQIALHVRRSADDVANLQLLTPGCVGYARCIAVALDTLNVCDWRVPDAARRLGHASSQIANWLAADPAVLGVVNQERRRRGLNPLRPRD